MVWVFTINNFEDTQCVKEWSDVKDAIWQSEVGASGTPHLQGFVRFVKNKRLTALKKLSATAHWEASKDPKAAIAYCSKEDTRVEGPWTIGSPGGQQGKRKDIEEAVARIESGDDVTDIISDIPGMVRYRSHLLSHSGAIKNKQAKKARVEVMKGLVLRPWQQDVVDMLDLPADDRHVLWIFERIGNVGKSTLGKYLEATRDAWWTTLGKKADMAYAYDRQRIVVFDVARTNESALDNLYSIAESLKNGSIFSSKYESIAKVFDPPHVVVFSNEPPNRSKMSKDRFVVFEVVNDTLVSSEEDTFDVVSYHEKYNK